MTQTFIQLALHGNRRTVVEPELRDDCFDGRFQNGSLNLITIVGRWNDR